MGKRGPEKRYTKHLHVYIDEPTLALLDKLRGDVSRSEYIRGSIRTPPLYQYDPTTKSVTLVEPDKYVGDWLSLGKALRDGDW